jgi:hypothetical protein
MTAQADDETEILRLDSEWNEAYRLGDRSLTHPASKLGGRSRRCARAAWCCDSVQLKRFGSVGRVIFSDTSDALLQHTRTAAEQMRVLDRCTFLRAGAEDLSAIQTIRSIWSPRARFSSISTTRSVRWGRSSAC